MHISARSRNIGIVITIALVATILIASEQGAFYSGYGIPGITIQSISESAPEAKTTTINSAYGSVTIYDYTSAVATAKWSNMLGQQRYVNLRLHVTLEVNIQTTDLASPQYETTIESPTFVVKDTDSETQYTNSTIQTYGYGFKVETQWSGSANINVEDSRIDSLVPPGTPSYDDLVKQASNMAIQDFNKNYLTSAKVLLSINAPTLATDQAYSLNPDFLGIMGMWLSDYKMAGYTAGTGAQLLPNSKGTSVSLYTDASLSQQCWTPKYSSGAPLLTPTQNYWLNHFAVQNAYWQINLVNLGVKLVFDDTKQGPNYFSWAHEKYGDGTAPVVDQWFRVDLAFHTTKGWTVPKIPNYELPPEEQQNLNIEIPAEPTNPGVPKNLPPVTTVIPWSTILWLLIIIVGVAIVSIGVYYAYKKKR